ncbi:MAG: hypothetical protein D6741_12305 [Planctomycetota bacterium]|nr:MAG: hypothetical protein D6741_12305 [Planctomycetota bacterium]
MGKSIEERREYWQAVWAKAQKDIEENGVLVYVERNGQKVPRYNPALKVLADAERMLQKIEAEYGEAEIKEGLEAIDETLLEPAKKVRGKNTKKRQRGQSSNR